MTPEPTAASRPKNIGVVIVNYFKASEIIDAIPLFEAQTAFPEMRISVVDNSCNSQQSEILRNIAPQIESLTINDNNVGYSLGVNQAATALGQFDYLLLASPDVKPVSSGVVQAMCDLMDDRREIGVLATTQSNPDGSAVEVARSYPSPFRQLARRLMPGKLLDMDLLAKTGDAPHVRKVPWVQSSFVMIRGPLWNELGGFDYRYHIFMADTDLSRRADKLGQATAVVSGYEVKSDGVRASAGGIIGIVSQRVGRIHLRDALTYYTKWYLPFAGPALADWLRVPAPSASRNT